MALLQFCSSTSRTSWRDF